MRVIIKVITEPLGGQHKLEVMDWRFRIMVEEERREENKVMEATKGGKV